MTPTRTCGDYFRWSGCFCQLAPGHAEQCRHEDSAGRVTTWWRSSAPSSGRTTRQDWERHEGNEARKRRDGAL